MKRMEPTAERMSSRGEEMRCLAVAKIAQTVTMVQTILSGMTGPTMLC